VDVMTVSDPSLLEAPGAHDGHHHGRPRDEARERAILDATLKLVAEVGVDRLTMDAVAQRAHASKATIYRRWAGKQELVVDAMKHYASDTVTDADVDTGSLRGDLAVMVTEIHRKIAGFDGRLILGLAHASLDDPGLCRAVDDQLEEVKSQLPRVIVERAVRRGELPEGADPSLFYEIMMGMAVMRRLAGLDFDQAFANHLIEDLIIPALAHPPTFPLRIYP
jgi:AcrR family transcriptional regulator